MPLLDRSTYCAARWLRHGHVQTIYPVLFRRGPRVSYQRKRIETPDGDFLDLDWASIGSHHIGLIVHGLESSSQQVSIRAMANALNQRGWDAVVLNLRGCSGEPNRLARSYNAGDTLDVATAIEAVERKNRYDQIGLIGFSLGGNLILKYLGEHPTQVPESICRASAVSVPCDLVASVNQIMRPGNRLYMSHMLRSLNQKVRMNRTLLEQTLRRRDLHRFRSIADFDEHVTAPLHGFANALDYWSRSSCKPWMAHIAIPTLLINAQDDPLLAPSCFPFEIAQRSKHLVLEVPKWGGHVGFVRFGFGGEYWHETRIASFITMTGTTADVPANHR